MQTRIYITDEDYVNLKALYKWVLDKHEAELDLGSTLGIGLFTLKSILKQIEINKASS